MDIVNYLDLTLSLNDRFYSPYKKPDEEKNYIHVNFKINLKKNPL